MDLFKLTILCLSIFICLVANGQTDSLAYEYIDESGAVVSGHFEAGTLWEEKLIFVIDSLSKIGYINASIDELKVDEKTALIYKGDQILTFKVNRGNLTPDLFDDLKLYRIEEPADWNFYGLKLRDFLGNQGYPFAQIKLDSFEINEQNLQATINLNKGPQIKFDSIYVEGDLIIKPDFLMYYLGLESGGIYNHSSFVEAENLLKALPFVKIKDTPKLKFVGKYASLHLSLDRKNASRMDLLVGVNPLEQNGETRFFITLDFEAEAQNLLHLGEYLRFRYSRLKPENQELEVALRYPYLLKLPIAANGEFGLYRKSLEYQDVMAEAGADYLVSTKSSIGLAWTYLASRLINVDSLAILSREKLPNQLDVVRTGLKVKAVWSNLDQANNPTKGWGLNFQLGASTKKVIKNDKVISLMNERVDFKNSYDTLALSGYQVSLNPRVQKFFPIGKNFTIKSSLDGYFLISNIEIYENEYERIGGNQLLRGFDEESILARSYAIAGLAFQVLLDESSFLSLPFIDFGWVNTGAKTWEPAFGLGAGINFQTTAGMLNFSIAAGKYSDGPFDFARPKVHIGFLRLF